MDLHVFVQSLTLAEMNKLSDILHDAKKEYIRQNMQPVSDNERMLVFNGEYIAAIKEYRARLQCSLLEAKVAIDTLRSKLTR